MEETPRAGPGKAWLVSFLAIALVNAGFAIARIVDAVNAHAGRLPRFSLLLPMWLQPEGRFAVLAVLAAMPALSFALPLLAITGLKALKDKIRLHYDSDTFAAIEAIEAHSKKGLMQQWQEIDNLINQPLRR